VRWRSCGSSEDRQHAGFTDYRARRTLRDSREAEFKRKVGGVIHGSSSSGQTVFVEPMETIEHNNELARLLDEEQGEIHRILVAMTRAIAAQSDAFCWARDSWVRPMRTRRCALRG
jgi:dsDNA-specific endonuclease/ATPase MutS2